MVLWHGLGGGGVLRLWNTWVGNEDLGNRRKNEARHIMKAE